MKKIAALLTLSLLTACTYSNGDMNFLPIRNKVFEVFQTEKIFYYDAAEAEYLSGSEMVYETNTPIKQPLSVKKGDAVFSRIVTRVDHYSTEILKVTENAQMNSSYTPVDLKKDQTYKPFGEVKFNDTRYMLVRHHKSKDVLLVAENGEIYHRIGRIVNGRLAILEATFFLEPESTRMVPIVSTREEAAQSTEFYKIVYNGIKDGFLSFTYIPCDPAKNTKEYLIPQDKETFKIKDMKIDIINAREDKLSYMLL